MKVGESYKTVTGCFSTRRDSISRPAARREFSLDSLAWPPLGFSTWAAGSQILDGQPSHGGWLKIKMFCHFDELADESTLTVATSLARHRKTTRKICNQKEINDADQLEAELASLELFPIAD